MLTRHGKTNDQLGVLESMEDSDIQGKGLNVSAKFFLQFLTSIEETEQRLLQRHFETFNPPLYFYAILDTEPKISLLPDYELLDTRASH
jgi:hypothetical protein